MSIPNNLNSKSTAEALEDAVADLKSFADEVDRRGTMTAADQAGLKSRMDKVSRLKAHKEIDEAKSFMSKLGPGGSSGSSDEKQYLRLDGSAIKAATTRSGDEPLVKSLISGTYGFGTQTVTGPVPLGMPATSLLDLVPFQELEDGNRSYTYLRQTTRTNNAAPVAPGAVKPTSIYTLESVTGKLHVIAHLSEPMNVYDLQDNSNLEMFLDAEMRYGLAAAVTAQMLTGDGTGENLTGFAHIPGTQGQTFVTDPILTSRAGLTKLETKGLSGLAYVFNPVDWETIETTKTTGGDYLLRGAGAPIDRVERRLWGVRVVVDNAAPIGTGWLIAEGAVKLRGDRHVMLGWGTSGDDFNRNLVRARCEGRFDLEADRPLGLVSLDLTA